MNVIADARRRHGFSQRILAKRAGLSFPCVQRLERADHNARLSSLEALAQGMDLPSNSLAYHLQRAFTTPRDSMADVSLRILSDGFSSWKTHLFNMVDRFRADKDAALISMAPISELDARLQALFAGTVELLCAEAQRSPPAWCCSVRPLLHPWFVSEMESLKASALIESPGALRARNVFVLSNFLARA